MSMQQTIAVLLLLLASCATSEFAPLPIASRKHATIQEVNPVACEPDFRELICEPQFCPGFTQPCFIGIDWSDYDCDGIINDDDRVNPVDNCARVCNPDQTNSDTDHRGDACDPCPLDPADDIDKDGVCGDTDNCPAHHNPQQEDADSDGFGDPCDQSEAPPIS